MAGALPELRELRAGVLHLFIQQTSALLSLDRSPKSDSSSMAAKSSREGAAAVDLRGFGQTGYSPKRSGGLTRQAQRRFQRRRAMAAMNGFDQGGEVVHCTGMIR